MILSSLRIVLVGTSHSGNLGATARAMKTMGLSRLVLVNPEVLPDGQSYAMAAGAEDLLTQCSVVSSLQQALADCQIIIATSARPRGISLPGLTPAACAQRIHAQPDGVQAAIVFGRERSGLTNDELLHCHYHVHIPTCSEFSSLNLAQAVQIMAYEMRMKHLDPQPCVTFRENLLATAGEVEQFYAHLEQVMIAIDFFNPDNPKQLLSRLRRLFNRVGLERMEVNILRGILGNIQKSLQQSKESMG